MTKGYLFEVLPNGKYKITHEADVNIFNINRIYQKVKVEGRRLDFEEVELRTRGYSARCIVKRKDITEDVLKYFITSYYNGDRSMQHRPYNNDLFDDDILQDVGVYVLTYKRFYSGSKELLDAYYPVSSSLSEEKLQEVTEKLDAMTSEAVKEFESYEICNKSITKSKPYAGPKWKEVAK